MNDLSYSKRTNQYEDFKKIFCAYHNEEFLTNFCVDSRCLIIKESCLMPLCPSCIVEHTDEHYRDQSKPMYMNIHEALHHARETCYQSIVELEDSAHKIKEMKSHRAIFLEQIRRKLDDHKRQIIEEIQKMFISYEKQIHNSFIREQEQQGLFNANEIQQNQEITRNAITELYQKIGMLKGDQCLAALIMFFGEGRNQIQNKKSNLKDFINRNEKRKVETRLNGLVVQSKLENLFEDSIEVLIQKEKVREEVRESRTASRYLPINQTSPPRNSRYIRQYNTSGSKKSRIFEGAEYSPSRSKLATSHRRDQDYRQRNY